MTGSEALLDNQGLLSHASMEALALEHQPFAAATAGGELFEDDATRALIADINSALYGNDDVLLILGTPGSGRSTLLRQLAANSQSRIACFSVKGTARFDTAHLFGSILDAFKTPVPTDLKDALDALVPNLHGTFERYNRLSTIVLDDADQVPVDELTKLLSSVLYLNGQEEPLLRVLLSGSAEFEDRLPDALPEGAEIRYASLVIEPLDFERTENYLEFRLNQAGYFEEFPFTDSDTQSIIDASGGFPGTINVAAALNLNEQNGSVHESLLPPELVEKRRSGKAIKMLLGGMACLMIVAGLFMFTQSEGERSPAAQAGNEYRTVETVAVTPASSQPQAAAELQLVDEADNSATQLASGTAITTPPSTDASTASTDTSTASGSGTGNSASNTAANATGTAESGTRTASAAVPAAVQAPASALEADSSDEGTAAAPATASASEATNTAAAAPSTETASESNSATELASAATTATSTSAAAPNSDEDLLADTTNSSPNTATAGVTGVLESPNWILVQDASAFTVQMSASTDRASVESFFTRNELPGPSSIFSFNRNGATWYALVYGLFEDVPAAREALRALPEGALRNQPWIRRVGQVQSALKEQN